MAHSSCLVSRCSGKTATTPQKLVVYGFLSRVSLAIGSPALVWKVHTITHPTDSGGVHWLRPVATLW